ncbi:MAG: fatty acid desaturase [Kiloniellales bacterium]
MTAKKEQRRGRGLLASLQWSTLAVAAAIYGGFGLTTFFHDALPWWVLAPLGGWLVAWHGSLQHEAVHGGPTPWPLVNRALVWPQPGLWLPYPLYVRLHLAHHDDQWLTDPDNDPESFYVRPETWERMSAPLRAVYWINNTLLGRVTLGPALVVARYWWSEAKLIARGDYSHTAAWLWHLPAVGVVLVWALAVCGLELWQYLLFFAYPGLSLTLVRSFLEHRAVGPVPQRTAIVESRGPMGLLFLHNNLHAVHHAEPELPWCQRPKVYRRERERFLKDNGSYVYSGYAEVFARFLLWPKESPVLPSAAPSPASGPAMARRVPA